MTNALFIHGMACTPAVWDRFPRPFAARGHEIHLATLPNHDRVGTALHDRQALHSLGLRDYADALVIEVKKLPEPPLVVGHSMGGLLALQLAERAPCRAVIALCPVAPWGIPMLGLRAMWLGSRRLAKSRATRKPFAYSLKDFSELAFNELPSAEHGPLYAEMVPEPVRIASEIGLWFLDRKKASQVDPQRVNCPVLIVGATKDRLTPARAVRATAKRFGTRATYREYAQHAHWIIGEPGWERVANDCIAWFEGTPRNSVNGA